MSDDGVYHGVMFGNGKTCVTCAHYDCVNHGEPNDVCDVWTDDEDEACEWDLTNLGEE